MSKLLVVLETDGSALTESGLAAVKFSQLLGTLWACEYDLLIIGGPAIVELASAWQLLGAQQVYLVAQTELIHPTADRAA